MSTNQLAPLPSLLLRCPVSTACALCFCPVRRRRLLPPPYRHRPPSSSPSVAKKVARHPTGSPIPQARPRRRAHHLPRCDDSHFHHIGGRRFSISPLRVQSSPVRLSSSSWVRSHGSIPPLQPAHRCSSDPQPPSAIGPPSSSTASASSYPPTPSRLSSTTRPPIGPSSSIREPRENNPAAVDSAVARRLSCTRLACSADPTTTRRRLGASARCIFDLPDKPSPRCPVLRCPDLPRFQSCNRAIADRDWRPLLVVVAGCRLNRPHSGSSAFYRTPSGHCFFLCARLP